MTIRTDQQEIWISSYQNNFQKFPEKKALPRLVRSFDWNLSVQASFKQICLWSSRFGFSLVLGERYSVNTVHRALFTIVNRTLLISSHFLLSHHGPRPTRKWTRRTRRRTTKRTTRWTTKQTRRIFQIRPGGLGGESSQTLKLFGSLKQFVSQILNFKPF